MGARPIRFRPPQVLGQVNRLLPRLVVMLAPIGCPQGIDLFLHFDGRSLTKAVLPNRARLHERVDPAETPSAHAD